MKECTADEWATHCARWRTVATEQNFRGGVSWMNLAISPNPPRPMSGQETGTAGAIVGRVEYRPDGSRVYFIA